MKLTTKQLIKAHTEGLGMKELAALCIIADIGGKGAYCSDVHEAIPGEVAGAASGTVKSLWRKGWAARKLAESAEGRPCFIYVLTKKAEAFLV